MKRYLIFGFFFSFAVQALADTCTPIHFSKCYGVDTLSGATLYEWEVVDCKMFRLKKYDTDYTCSKPGTLTSTDDSPIDGIWKESNHSTTQEPDETEYGTYFFKERYQWNADKSILSYEASSSKDVMATGLLDPSGTFYPEQEEAAQVRSYSKELDEIVERTKFSKRWKNRHTRGEWLENSHSEIDAYPAI